MGYSIDVHLPHHGDKWVEFSSNISHASMRHALCEAEAIASTAELYSETNFYPRHTMTALLPGYNGVRLTHLEAAVDAPKLVHLATVAEEYDYPSAWVLRVLADAALFARATQGEVVFG